MSPQLQRTYFWGDVPGDAEDSRWHRQSILTTPHGALIVIQARPNIDHKIGVREAYTMVPGYTAASFLQRGPNVGDTIPVIAVPPTQRQELSDLLRKNGFIGIIGFWTE